MTKLQFKSTSVEATPCTLRVSLATAPQTSHVTPKYIHEQAQNLHAAATGLIRGQTCRTSSYNTKPRRNAANFFACRFPATTYLTTETRMQLTPRRSIDQRRTPTEKLISTLLADLSTLHHIQPADDHLLVSAP